MQNPRNRQKNVLYKTKIHLVWNIIVHARGALYDAIIQISQSAPSASIWGTLFSASARVNLKALYVI
jgi:hypothetical protein